METAMTVAITCQDLSAADLRQAAARTQEALLHGSTRRAQYLPRHLTLCDADRDRASELQHAVQDMDGDGNLSDTTLILAVAQPIADHLLIAPDGSLDPATRVVA